MYGHDRLSEIVTKFPETKDGLTRFLYEIILRRMEIRDRSRSVNSIDVVFNFDCIGFTGTPFIDNYPTFSYLRDKCDHEIPTLIDRSFYVYSSDNLSAAQFEEIFSFQGVSENVVVEYVSSISSRLCGRRACYLGHVFGERAQPPPPHRRPIVVLLVRTHAMLDLAAFSSARLFMMCGIWYCDFLDLISSIMCITSEG